MARKLNIDGIPHLGIFSACTETLAIVPPSASGEAQYEIMESLDVEVVATTLNDSTVVGSLITGNSNGLLVTGLAGESEVDRLSEHHRVARLPGRLNAAGNLILANDHGALVHPDLPKRAITLIEDALDVPVERGTIGGLRVVGMAARATNKGVLAHPRITDPEAELLEDLLGVPVDIGTVNFGSPLVGSGLIANTKGYLAGMETTGPELGRIEDALGFI